MDKQCTAVADDNAAVSSGVCLDSENVIIFGAGESGKAALALLRTQGVNVLFICDNDMSRQGCHLEGIEIVPPGIMAAYREVTVVIASDWAMDIALQLKELGVSRYVYLGYAEDADRWGKLFNKQIIDRSGNEIDQLSKLLFDVESKEILTAVVKFRRTANPLDLATSEYQQYFHPEVSPAHGDTIIDGGAWEGDTAVSFCNALQAHCKVYSFEPSEDTFSILSAEVARQNLLGCVLPVKAGLWSSSGKLHFREDVLYSSQFTIDPAGTASIEVVSLDDYCSRNRIVPDCIKMDIEGSEEEAIKGCQDIIKKHGPKLMISVYHRPEDLWRIPFLIHSIKPDYRFFLGHHTQKFTETILYCVDPNR